MKSLKLVLICAGVILSQGCSIYNWGSKKAWKAEKKYARKYLDGDLLNKLNKEVEKGNLTQEQSDKILDGGTKFLEWVEKRAERLISEQKRLEASQ